MRKTKILKRPNGKEASKHPHLLRVLCVVWLYTVVQQREGQGRANIWGGQLEPTRLAPHGQNGSRGLYIAKVPSCVCKSCQRHSILRTIPLPFLQCMLLHACMPGSVFAGAVGVLPNAKAVWEQSATHPWQCPTCDKCFRRQIILQGHIKEQHNENAKVNRCYVLVKSWRPQQSRPPTPAGFVAFAAFATAGVFCFQIGQMVVDRPLICLSGAVCHPACHACDFGAGQTYLYTARDCDFSTRQRSNLVRQHEAVHGRGLSIAVRGECSRMRLSSLSFVCVTWGKRVGVILQVFAQKAQVGMRVPLSCTSYRH
jgi:hypothetical protein